MKDFLTVSWYVLGVSLLAQTVQAAHTKSSYIPYGTSLLDQWTKVYFNDLLAEGKRDKLPLASGFDRNMFDENEFFTQDSWNTLTETPVLVALVFTHAPHTGKLHIGLYRAHNFNGWLTKSKDYGKEDFVSDPLIHNPLVSKGIYYFELSKDAIKFVCTLEELVAQNDNGEALRAQFRADASQDLDDYKNAQNIRYIRLEGGLVMYALIEPTVYAWQADEEEPQLSELEQEIQEAVKRKAFLAEMEKRKRDEEAARAARREQEKRVQNALSSFREQLSTLTSVLSR